MSDKALEKLVGKLKELYGSNLISVTLYGSAASGDYVKKYSDFNIMVVLKKLDFPELARANKLAIHWTKQGNPPPLFFTPEIIRDSLDVFPMEFLDMMENHEVLFGDDPYQGLEVHLHHLRHECESELRSKSLRLWEAYLLNCHKPKSIKELLIQSSSSFFSIFRSVLRLLNKKPPVKKREVIEMLEKEVGIEGTVFKQVLALREGTLKPGNEQIDEMVKNYLSVIMQVTKFVEHLYPIREGG